MYLKKTCHVHPFNSQENSNDDIVSKEEIPIIDLTSLKDNQENERKSFTSNRLSKIVNVKVMRLEVNSKRKEPSAAQLYFSCFNKTATKNYQSLLHNEKRTYVGKSMNPFLGDALFAAENISKGEFINVYRGKRISDRMAEALQDACHPWEYMLSVGVGIVVDASKECEGASMANHSCKPNAKLDVAMISKSPKVPIGVLICTADIEMGQEIECDYGWISYKPERANKKEYMPCRCLKQGCNQILYYL